MQQNEDGSVTLSAGEMFTINGTPFKLTNEGELSQSLSVQELESAQDDDAVGEAVE